SNRMIKPPATPQAKPGRLLPPGQYDWLRAAAKYQTANAMPSRRTRKIQNRCGPQFLRSRSTIRPSVGTIPSGCALLASPRRDVNDADACFAPGAAVAFLPRGGYLWFVQEV